MAKMDFLYAYGPLFHFKTRIYLRNLTQENMWMLGVSFTFIEGFSVRPSTHWGAENFRIGVDKT